MNTDMSPRFLVIGCLALASVTALSGCQEEIHSAQWWMGHAPELQSKLEECKKYPSLNRSDKNCQHANEAFVTLLQASSQAAATPPQEPK